jgi:hypothetical protein
MSMKPSDRIIGPSRGSAATAKASFRNRGALRIKDVEAYVDAVYLLCMSDDMPDAAIVCSAADVETGTFTNKWWKERLNAGSLGVTGWGPDDAVSPTFTTGAHAAKAHVAHLLLYATGQIDRGGLRPADDPRFAAYREAYGSRAFPTLNDLSGRYAADTGYGATIARRSQVVYGDLPDQSAPTQETPPMAIEFGNVPHPPFRDLIVNNRYWNDLGQRRAIGVCQHSMVGTLSGSYGYINGGGGQALWDYSVGGSTDGANDGVIWRHNDPKGRRAGWANGGSDGLEGDGPLFVRTLGVDAINRDLVSIERSDGGNYNSQPMSPKQFESMAQLTAYWFDQARVPWDKYPLNPNVGCVTHMIHKEFATKDCPFPPVYNEIDRLQNRVRAILKSAQLQVDDSPDIETPPPVPIEQDHERYPNGWKPADLKKQWGVLPRTNPGGSVTRLHFAVTKNPIAAIANTWVQRGAADGITAIADLPKPQEWRVIQVDEDTKSDLITFEGGADAWMLFRSNINVPWTWIDERALKAKEA